MSTDAEPVSLKENEIFISYSHEDKETVHKISKILKNKFKVTPWLDESSILPGEQISKAVEQGIERADLLFLMISNNSLKSNWVDLEWRTKFEHEIINNQVSVVCVLIEDISSTKLPTYLRGKLWIDHDPSPTNVARNIYQAALSHAEKRKSEGNRAMADQTMDIVKGVMGNHAQLSVLSSVLNRVENSNVYKTENYWMRLEVLKLDIMANLENARFEYDDAKEKMDETMDENDLHPMAQMLTTMAAIKLRRDVGELEKLVIRTTGYAELVSKDPSTGPFLWEDLIECITLGLEETQEFHLE